MKNLFLYSLFILAVLIVSLSGEVYSADITISHYDKTIIAENTEPVLLAEEGGIQSSNRFLIVPGKSVGLIEMGKPISKKAMNLMGKPTNFTPPTTGKKGIDTGSYYWEDKLIIKINDGKNDLNVYQAFIISPKYYTTRGIRRGSTLAELKKAYPKGKKVELMDHDFGWQIPGMTFGVYEKKVTSMSVHPLKQMSE